ncbi:MAG: zf-HC2 domain-containing protein [Candidatus Tectomicrobia bacterium]|uniref:Zf-HC2 domain-containing protein n=1 Tax=Tectimicrobiota bacterium TaxID=2528274 RepID=A0A937W296_UNCTE|nr:zf-HC2 domain-containing protein [Candidatus Tectomicrobia bacterium]
MAEHGPERVTCEQATALLLDYITGELSEAITQVLERHLGCCVDCAVFLRTYRETIRATRTLQYEDIPAELQNRLLETLQTKIGGAPPQ